MKRNKNSNNTKMVIHENSLTELSIENLMKSRIRLNKEQQITKKIIIENDITVLTGKAGSGKTLTAVLTGIELLYADEVDKIVITRPTVGTEDIGFLKGDLNDKMQPWVYPVYDNIESVVGKVEFKKLILLNKLEIVPLQFFRGRTFLNKFIIADEVQNLTNEQTAMVMTRLGLHSKMVLCGDINQIDLKRKPTSGINKLINLRDKIEGVGFSELLTNHRHPVVDRILEYYAETEDFKNYR